MGVARTYNPWGPLGLLGNNYGRGQEGVGCGITRGPGNVYGYSLQLGYCIPPYGIPTGPNPVTDGIDTKPEEDEVVGYGTAGSPGNDYGWGSGRVV